MTLGVGTRSVQELLTPASYLSQALAASPEGLETSKKSFPGICHIFSLQISKLLDVNSLCCVCVWGGGEGVYFYLGGYCLCLHFAQKIHWLPYPDVNKLLASLDYFVNTYFIATMLVCFSRAGIKNHVHWKYIVIYDMMTYYKKKTQEKTSFSSGCLSDLILCKNGDK